MRFFWSIWMKQFFLPPHQSIGWMTQWTCILSHVLYWVLTLCDPMDYSLQGSSAHGIFQAKILELVAISYSRGSSWPRIKSASLVSSALAGWFFASEPLASSLDDLGQWQRHMAHTQSAWVIIMLIIKHVFSIFCWILWITQGACGQRSSWLTNSQNASARHSLPLFALSSSLSW